METIFAFILDKIGNEYPFTIVDIGAMGGIAKKWDFLIDYIKVIAFEPDEREFVKLKNNDNITYFNCALYNKSQDLKYYITKGHGISSIYKPNFDLLSQFEDIERFHIDKIEVLPRRKVKTLDSIIEKNSIDDIDFVKMDTQGSELKILEGCQNHVIHKIFGMQIEVEFIEMYKNQHLFRDVDEFMYKNDFQLIDLRRQYWKRKDYYDYVGKGQLVFGDALYFKKIDVLFRDLYKIKDKEYLTSKIYKIILLCLVYRMFDYAVSVAKMSIKLNCISQNEYKNILYEIKKYSNKNAIPDFIGKREMGRLVYLLGRILKMKSLVVWADSDNEIGNINDR